MENYIISFTKSFVRVIAIKNSLYEVIQNMDTGLRIVAQSSRDTIYEYDLQKNSVDYMDTLFPLIKQILHQAQIDRYPRKK